METRTAGSASGLGKRTGSNPDTAPQADSTVDRRGCRGLGGQELLPRGPVRRGAGSIPAACRICHTVEGAIGWPSLASSPCTRRCPHVGLSRAISSTSRRIAGPVRGRPGVRRRYVQCRFTSSACQRSSVRGVTIRASCARRRDQRVLPGSVANLMNPKVRRRAMGIEAVQVAGPAGRRLTQRTCARQMAHSQRLSGRSLHETRCIDMRTFLFT